MILRFPDGAVGAALVLLRCGTALSAFPALTYLRLPFGEGNAARILSGVLALLLVTGLGTRLAALVLAALLIGDLFSPGGRPVHLLLASAGGAGTLLVLGGGAYSIDARRYGRRVIRLQPRCPIHGDAE